MGVVTLLQPFAVGVKLGPVCKSPILALNTQWASHGTSSPPGLWGIPAGTFQGPTSPTQRNPVPGVIFQVPLWGHIYPH